MCIMNEGDRMPKQGNDGVQQGIQAHLSSDADYVCWWEAEEARDYSKCCV